MLPKLIKSKKSQIRGVDFTVAMIIFMLTMINVLVLTNDLISNTIQSTNIERNRTKASKISSNLLFGSGTENWETIQSSSLDGLNWTIGLGAEDSLNPYKLSRLSAFNLQDYLLNYTQIGRHLPIENRVYKLELLSPINNTILSLTEAGSNLDVLGTVSQNSEGIGNVEITIYAIRGTGSGNFTVTEQISTTNSTGYYSVSLVNLLPANFIGVLSFAKYLETYQDVSYSEYLNGATFSRTNATILKDSTGTLETTNLRVEKETGNNLSHVWVFSPAEGPASENYTEISSSQVDYGLPQYYNLSNLILPPQDMIVIFSLQNSSFTQGFYTINVMPVLFDGELEGTIAPTDEPNAISNTETFTAIVREVFLVARVTIWEVEL